MRDRAYRRHHESRIKARVLRILRQWGSRGQSDPAMVGIHRNSGMTLCSCPMCGNPRRTEGPTRQERATEPELEQAGEAVRELGRRQEGGGK